MSEAGEDPQPSIHGEVRLEFGGERRAFRLAIGELRALQDRCGVGPFALYRRVLDGSWRVDDSREVIRLGLEGAGVSPREAGALVRRYVEERPLLEAIAVAAGILMAALYGPEVAQAQAEALDEEEEEAAGKAPTPETGSTSANSMEPQERSA